MTKPYPNGMSKLVTSLYCLGNGTDFPGSHNCTKHKCRCPYTDGLEKEQREPIPKKPNLLWTSEIEAEIQSWQQTGRPRLSSLYLSPAIPFKHFSFDDLRLIHHVASISSELSKNDASNFTIWVRQVPLCVAELNKDPKR